MYIIIAKNKDDQKWYVFDKNGTRLGGPFDTQEEAEVAWISCGA